MPRSPAPATSSRLTAGRTALRAVALALTGLTAVALGLAGHAPRLALGEGDLVDVLWALMGVAGLALVVAAFVIVLRGRRLRWKLCAGIVVLVLLQFYVLPVVLAGLAVNADRFDVAPASSLGVPGA